MMRRWLGPLVLALAAAIGAYLLVLHRTPQFLMSAAVKRVGQAGMNRFFHAPLATDKSRAVVRPSPDLAYSSCPFDLSTGAVVVTAPPLPARYWSLSIFDADTDVAYVRNNVEVRGAAMRVVIARRGQAVPADQPDAWVDGMRGVALIRILVDDRVAFPAIDRARRASTCGVQSGRRSAG